MTNSDSSKTKIRGTIDLRKHKSNLLKDEYRSRIDSKKWLEAEFSNEKRLKTHIKKHIHQYGNITYEEYIKIARELMTEPLSDDVIGFVSRKGFVFKGRISTNDFVLGREDMKISTLFKPDDGVKNYMKEQVKKHGKI